MKRIFVTGGTGFVGRQIVNLLSAYPEIELFLLTRRKNADTDNIHHIQGDMSDIFRLASEIARIQPTDLIHLAWDVKSESYAGSPWNDKWVEWSRNLLELFLLYGGRTVVASGTCFEYDYSRGLALSEDTLGMPNTSYGKAKLAVCHMYRNLCRQYGARMVWGRIFYTYGKGEEKRKLFSAVIEAMKSNKHFVCKTPDNLIDYIHVSDVAKIFSMFLLKDKAEGIVNVGTGKAIKIRDILLNIARLMGKEDLLTFSSNTAVRIVADTQKLSSLYDTRSFIELEDGLKYLMEAE